MGSLQVRLLGGLSLVWDGLSRLTIAGNTSRSLFAYLITYRHRSHTRNLLAGTFWPDLPEATARQRLSQALWQINRVFEGDPVLFVEGDIIQVNSNQALWVDLDEFKNFPKSNETEALRKLETCLEHYRGEFLAGYYDDWILTEREQLRNLYLELLTRLVLGYKTWGMYEKSLTFAKKLCIEDSWSEETHREIMRLNHLLGRSTEAYLQFETCRRVLKDELGVDPSPETQSLALEIAEQTGLTGLPWVPTSARPRIAPLLERPDRLPLVGRQSELAELLNQVESAVRGEGALSFVYGEAGVGKTRLLSELERNAEWRGIRTAWGRCYELTGPPAYQPLVEIMRAELPVLSENLLESVWRVELARLLPELAVDESIPHLDPEKEQHRILEAIARGFQAITQDKPYLAILEDAHWMDPGSLEVLRYLLPRLPEMPILIVVSVRGEDLSGEQAEALTSLENTRLPHRLELLRLGLDETKELVQRALDLPQSPALFSARLYQKTEGNPFFLTETIRSLIVDGLLYRDEEGVWSTPWDELTQDYAEMSLPGSVIQTITRRLDRMPPSSRDALGLAAVIGRGIPFGLWLRSSGLSEMGLIAIGDQLCSQGVLICADHKDSSQANFDYIFTHDQIRRVTYDQLAPPRLRMYHRRVAEALTELGRKEPAPLKNEALEIEALAYHWSQAQVWDQAADFHQQAGDRARAVYANTEAVDHYRQALHALQRLPGPPDLERIYANRLACEKVYELQGERGTQTQELDALEKLAETLNDDCRRAEVALRRARQAQLTCDFPSAIKAASIAAQLARAGQDTTIEIESHFEWGWALLLQGEHSPAQGQFEQALALARATDQKRLEADGLHGLGTVGLVTGDYEDAKTFFCQVLEIAQQIDIRPREATAYANLGYIGTAQGNHIAAKFHNEQALRLHRETGDQRGEALVTQNLSDEYLAEGDFSTAKEYMERAVTIQQEVQAHDNVGVTLRGLGILYHQLGDYERARDFYEQAQAIFSGAGIPYYQGQTLAFLSLLSHHLGDNQTARKISQRGLEIAREINDRLGQGWLLDSLGHALVELGQLDDAEATYQESLALHLELNEPHLAAESRSGLARVALQQGNLVAAMEQVEEILQIQKARGFGGTNEPFRIDLTCFQVLDACGDSRAGDILTTAYQNLMAQKENIRDIDLERSYLENVAANHEIISAYEKKRGEQVVARLPKADAPTGRALRSDEWVDIRWTPHAPEDEAIPDKTTRRRHRLQRLLNEATEQGAAPTLEDLATILNVSTATIKRDLAALREAGIPIQTRGSRTVTSPK
jgi:DNA-binding SARP family transcriptional activator/tetratricopeptide (TPR) repeat protein/biotin operon repressor